METTSSSKSLDSELFLVDAVCGCSNYLWGFDVTVLPGANNCLPNNWSVGIHVPPFHHTRKRQHLQLMSPRIDFVSRLLEAGTSDSPGFLRPEKGWNACDTPCTDWGSLVRALRERQRIGQPDRPFNIDPRHLRGFELSVHRLYTTLTDIITNTSPERPDYRTRWMKYSGTKREHYRQCALEEEMNPLSSRTHEIYHDASVKWGELSAKPRALLVQTVRAKGAPGVKPGTPLRSPIMVEGGYRDLVEDALHHYCHSRGYEYVASGMDLFTRAEKIKSFSKPGDLVLSLDWTSFDGSLGELAVVERMEFLRRMENMFGTDASLRAVIETQNCCRVQGGPVRAQIYGNRGSGTAGTSTGNKCVVLAAIAYALGPAFGGRRGVRLLCDGDDTLIFVPSRFADPTANGGRGWVQSWVRRFSQLGLETKVQQQIRIDSPESVQQIRFCRAGVFDSANGPFLCKEPFDALKVLTNYRKHFRGKRFPDYLQTLSVGIRNTYEHVPILRLFSCVFDVGGKNDKSLMDTAGFEYMMARQNSVGLKAPDVQARLSFQTTFGVSVEDQLRCEAALAEEIPNFRKALSAYLSGT